ncbi:MAG: glutamate--tRNA ligase [Candidatus Margulisbacteria bacterium]|nr:glutamate--tRNA ligase [Candidatus Margulisiibacteriota bacterium]
MTFKLRFAPSPTGNLHIGSVRTAIFNWVWATSLGARLVLRIEDTDMVRSDAAYEQNIMDGLAWLGLAFDEGPHQPNGAMKYRQSERIQDQTYAPYISKLIDNGHAYYAFETDEELAAERQAAEDQGIPYVYSRKSLNYSPSDVAEKLAKGQPYVVRFKVPEKDTIVVKDAIRGDIAFESGLLSDFVIVKSDGVPTYNFAVVVDDADMGITHVVRGEDHIANTPKQLMIYAALGFDVPMFAHLPIILGPDRSKLSKRHGAKSVTEYKDEGFLPDALINYLSLLGWSPPQGQEFLSRTELCELFDMAKINKAGAVFDTVKLTWMNKHYLAKKTDDELLALVHPFVHPDLKQMDDLDRKILSVRDNISTLADINQYLGVYSQGNHTVLEKFKALPLPASDVLVIDYLAKVIPTLNEWHVDGVQRLIDDMMGGLNLGKGKVMKPFRKCLTGEESGPNLVDCLSLIPLSDVQTRIKLVVEHVKSTSPN